MITLKNNRLTVTVAEPNLENITYRFDRAAFITSVVLDGKYEFCSEEGGGSNGVGLCSEIQCDPLSAEVPVGDTFVKFGVGVLTKTEDRPYSMMKQYPCSDFEVKADVKEDGVVFETAAADCKGYALREKKTLSIRDNMIRMEYEFTNAGEKELEFAEYVHNFVAPNGHRMDSSFNQFSKNSGDRFEWKMLCASEGLCFREVDYFNPDHMNFWTNISAICPEVFYKKALQPGETAKWVREWYFETREEMKWTI